MSEIVIVTSSDEHLADITPGFRKDEYRETILEKIEWQGDFARKVSAHALVRGGDFFHVKAANKTTMGTMARAAAIHRTYPCPTYSIVGNHDLSRNDITTVDRQPIGVMFNSGVFFRLTRESMVAGSMSVRLIGVDYRPDMNTETLREILMQDDEEANYRIAFIHALAENEPSERVQSHFDEEIMDYRDLVFEGCPDVYVFGHYHKDQGIQEHLGVKFVNLGSVSRGALNVDNVSREPKVSTITINSQGISIEEHVIPHRDASEIFDFERKKQMEKERRSLAEFISCLNESVSMASGSDVEEKRKELMSSKSFPDDLKSTAVQILEAVESGSEIQSW